MRRQDKPKREPKRQGLEALAGIAAPGAAIRCLRCNQDKPQAGAEPFGRWGHVCAGCAKHLRQIDARAAAQKATAA